MKALLQSRSGDLQALLEQIGSHDHLCLIYETREQQFAAVLPFMRIGLERGEKCLYIADDNTVEAVLEEMRRESVNIDEALRTGAFAVVSKRETYLKAGHFDPDLMIGLLREATLGAVAEGYKGFRATGEMTWMLSGDPGSERLIEYESKLNHFFPNYAAVAICQYNRNRFPPEIILDVIRTHPIVIYGGLVCRNFYYVPPEEFIGGEVSREVERLLQNIVDREQAHKALLRDMAERRNAEARLERTNRALRMVSACNQVLIRAKSMSDFLPEICRLVVELGGYRLAWVGFALEDDARTVLPIAHAGAETTYLKKIRVSWAEDEHGRGPGGTAIRTGKPSIFHQAALRSDFAPWREVALEHGFASVAGLPLLADGRPFGVLLVYSGSDEGFDEQEVGLLQELAGDIAYGVTVLRIRAERERAQEQVRQLNAELEERVRQRTAELEAANRELESFSYSVSHDLRAPLRAIDGFSRILISDYGAELSAEAHDYLRWVRQGAQQMGQLIDDLLDFSRLGRQPIRREVVQPADLVSHAIELLRPETGARNIRWEILPMPICQADPVLLQQVFVNLLGNAVKFTRRRDPAVIGVGSLREGGEDVYFVRDNGVGFDMQYGEKLFGVFQRLHRADEYEGTGVGLAIVQRIIHRHGGRVWAKAAPGEGATFYFTIGLESPFATSTHFTSHS